MTDEPPYRLYGDLAGWWPLISPVGEYARDAADLAAAAVAEAVGPVREVLDLGGGGGHLAAWLKDRFALTVVDASAWMLAVSQRLNPECEHVEGDMRTARLDREFDAVLVHDAASYLLSEEDARLAAATAFAHCRPGGAAVFAPDWTAETFRPGGGGGGSWGDGGVGGPGRDGTAPAGGRRAARFRERRWDPVPGDGWVRVDYEFTLRDADGSVRAVRETHRLGALPRTAWLRALAGAGFEPRWRQGAGSGRDLLAGRRLGTSPSR